MVTFALATGRATSSSVIGVSRRRALLCALGAAAFVTALASISLATLSSSIVASGTRNDVEMLRRQMHVGGSPGGIVGGGIGHGREHGGPTNPPPPGMRRLGSDVDGPRSPGKGRGVSCGPPNERAETCDKCGRAKCGGDCVWRYDDAVGRDRCVPRPVALSCHPELEQVSICEQCPTDFCQDDCFVMGNQCVLKTMENVDESFRNLESVMKKMRVRMATERRVEDIYGTVKLIVETLSAEEARRNMTGKWFASSGTLVGATRCRPPGMMRWDDDVDFAVRGKEDMETVHSILSANPAIEWQHHSQFMAYQYRRREGNYQYEWQYDVDLFGLGRNGSDWHIMDPDGKKPNSDWESDRFEDEEIRSMVPCRFWDLMLPCPVGTESYLRRTFGTKVDTVAVVSKMEAVDKPVLFNLKSENLNQHAMYYPAMTRELMDKLVFNNGETRVESGR